MAKRIYVDAKIVLTNADYEVSYLYNKRCKVVALEVAGFGQLPVVGGCVDNALVEILLSKKKAA